MGKTKLILANTAIASALGFFIGYSISPDPQTDYLTTVNSADAEEYVWRYGYWVGQSAVSVEQHMGFTNQIQFAAGWDFPIAEMAHDLENAAHVQAYGAIKNDAFLNWKPNAEGAYEMPEIELVMAIPDPHNEGAEIYHNLIKPCPNLCNESSALYTSFLAGLDSGRAVATRLLNSDTSLAN